MDSRKARLVAELAPAAVPLFQYWLEERHIMKQTEAQKEVIEAQAQAVQQPQGVQQAAPAQAQAMKQPQGSQTAYGHDIPDRSEDLRRLAEQETCGTCAAALRRAAKYDPEKQQTALEEYDQLKDKMEAGSDTSELSEFLESTEVLGEAIQAAV